MDTITANLFEFLKNHWPLFVQVLMPGSIIGGLLFLSNHFEGIQKKINDVSHRPLLLFLLVFAILDAATTITFVTRIGLHLEGNKLIFWLIEEIGLFPAMLAKIILTSCVLYLLFLIFEYMKKRELRAYKFKIYLFAVGCIFIFVVGANTTAMVLPLIHEKPAPEPVNIFPF